ncbi:MAG: amino acid adenylation domain-containing protein [Lachnospiraceae bacterium]|nr:amino acid adenylation domain-containing protein [Lachnospiraceae bacterium]
MEKTTEKRYPLSKEEMSLYLACTMNPERKNAYVLGWSLKLPVQGEEREQATIRLKGATEAVFARHRILCARFCEDGQGSLYKYDSGETPIIEVETRMEETTPEEDNAYCSGIQLEGGRLYRVILVDTPAMLNYYLIVHHIVMDGTGMQNVVRDLQAAYRGEKLGEPDYAPYEFAMTELKEEESEAYALDKAYFTERLSGAEGQAPEPDKHEESESFAHYSCYFDRVSPQDVKQKKDTSGVRTSTIFTGAVGYALALFTGVKQAVLATAMTGRRPETKESCGMFVRTLPILCGITPDRTVDAYLRDLDEQTTKAREHSLYTYLNMNTELGLTVPVCFAYQGDMDNDTILFDGREYQHSILQANDSDYETRYYLFRKGNRYLFEADYRSDHYSEAFLDSFAKTVEQVLLELLCKENMADVQPAAPEARNLLAGWNETKQAYPMTDIVSMFREAAEKKPDNLAVIFKDEQLTYRQVDDLSECIAGYLREKGIGKGDVVSILIPRCSYMVTASLGVLKSGAAYQPLDPSYPAERLSFMMQDAGCKLLIAEELLMEKVPDYQGPVLLTKEIQNLPACEPLKAHPAPEDLFILLYTSGSTGTPKGVMLEHRNLSNFCFWYRDYYQLDESCKVAAYASYGFDANMMDLYPALTTGACVCIIEEEIRLDLLAMEAWFNRLGITHSFMTTQVGRQFYSMASPEKLRYLSTGGEKLVPVAPREGNVQFFNVYGPTECTIFTTTQLVDRQYERVPIGKPLANYACYVVDEKMRLLPPFAPGELIVSGRGVGRGYLNRPDLSGKIFISNPFSDDPTFARAYHTGDVVRFLADGTIDFIGRNDGQVKVRGFRIELTEVEAVIRTFPGITDATVQAFEDEASGEKYIAAYVVSDQTVDVPALEDFIRQQKPPYMVPAVTMQLDAIPLNQNQKVNKRALPRPVRVLAEMVRPKNETQQKIFDLVAEVVGHTSFGVTTDLAEAGLSSIGAIRLNVLLSKAFDMAFTTRDLKEQDTIEKLEAFIEAGQDKDAEQAFPVLPEYPLSKTQEGVYVESISRADSTVYNIPILMEISPSLEIRKLKEAIVAAVDAHPFIKTRLFLNDDGDVRMRRMDGDYSFDAASIEELSVDSIDEIKDTLVKPFKLIGGKLFRVKLIRDKEQKLFLFLEMHHLISDGTSVGILLSDISRAYHGETLESEGFSGYEVVQNEEKLRTEDRMRQIKQYYEKLLDEAETQSLPVGDIADGTAVAETGEDTKTGLYEIDGAYAGADEVRAFCKENGLSMNAFFSAAFGHLLNAYLNTDKVVFAGIYNGRSDSRMDRSVAMLVKTIPIVAGTNSEETVVDQVRAMGRQLSDTQARDLYSFAEISRQMNVNADVMFAYQGDEFSFDTFCGEKACLIPLDLGAAKAPVNVTLQLLESRIHVQIEYDSLRYSERYIEAFAERFDYAVKELLTKKKMAEVSFMTDAMQQEMDRFNDTSVSVRPAFAPERFLQAVAKYADKTAVIAKAGTQSVTFAELGSRARKVAYALQQKGIGRGNRVGLYMNRTEDVYAIREGIMLAGAAFVSLEPDYPDERISFILENAQIQTLVTTEALYESRKNLFEGHVDDMRLEDIYAVEIGEDSVKLPELLAEDPAYCIYTSGSTGLPKGVEILHKNLRNLLDYNDKNILAHAYVDHSSVFLALAAITFDVSIIEEMMTLYHGKTVCMATEDEIHNPMLLVETMKKTGADMMKCTPSYMLSILEAPGAGELFAQLNAMILGAEPCPKGMQKKLRDAGFKGIIFNSYGPTETCVSVSIGTITERYITIGGPTANTRFLIRDRFGNLLPAYMRGELVIAGEQVGNGYVGLPEKTKQAFISLQENGETVSAYRSGDVAYFNAEGEIMHCGRNDNQVKIRGLRVELDGIENTMNTYPGIERSVVLVLGEGEGKYLAGYYVAKEAVDESDLSRHLRKTLTAYMVPAVYVHLTVLPLTVNGKVNKKALPKPEVKKKEAAGKESKNPLQTEIAEMFAHALGLEDFGLYDDFFEAGGTSMLASKVAMRAMVKGLPISYQDVFAHPSVADMERHVLTQRGEKAPEAPKPIEDVTPDKKATLEAPEIAKALSYNTMEHVNEIAGEGLGSVLLTGATGFLGIHVLRYLIENTSDPIICLIRKGHYKSPEKRMQMLLMYYFDTPFTEVFESGRIRTVDGDITDREIVLEQKHFAFDTIINCAACVKHFANDDILERVNVTGVKNLISLCEETGRKLVHISTVSVAGENVNHALDGVIMRENMLYFGQDLSNQYVSSKFDAEKAILTEIAAGRLSAKIIRVGNLMARDSDGEFQVNAVTSGFWRNLRGYATIGACPVSSLARPVEFSPIDKVAETVCLLGGTPEKFTLFHSVNGHWIEMGDVIAALNEVGIPIEVVSDEEFQLRMKEAMEDENKNMLVSGLISYLSSDTKVSRSYITEEHTFTKNALYHLGFRWPLTDEAYLEKSIQGLKTLGFFDDSWEQEE